MIQSPVSGHVFIRIHDSIYFVAYDTLNNFIAIYDLVQPP